MSYAAIIQIIAWQTGPEDTAASPVGPELKEYETRMADPELQGPTRILFGSHSLHDNFLAAHPDEPAHFAVHTFHSHPYIPTSA